MKIQPEFNIAVILSKISVADVAGNQLSAVQRATSPFESYFEAALQEIDDPQLAATIATLNESGMIQPDSSGAFSAPDAGSGLLMAAGPEALPLSFRTLQLLNGRSVITTSVAFSDTAIRSPAMSEGLLAENPAFKQQSALIRAQIGALLGDTAIVPKEREVAAALDLDERAKLIVKLPGNFEIETPAGGYNPDWAIVLEDGGVVYLVRETKGGTDLEKLQYPKERMKIRYGVKHFDAIGADYDWLEKASQVKAKSLTKRKI